MLAVRKRTKYVAHGAGRRYGRRFSSWLLPRVFLVIFAVAILGFGSIAVHASDKAAKRATQQKQPIEAKQKTTPQKSTVVTPNAESDEVRRIEAMSAEIQRVLAENPDMTVSVAISDTVTGKTYQYGDTEGFYAASVSKLLTAMLYLHKVETGERSLEQYIGGRTAESQLRALIEDSDNTAWLLLDANLGRATLQSWAKEIGLSQFDVYKNIVSAPDIARLLHRFYTSEIITTAHRDLLLGYMANASRDDLIARTTPEHVNVYHKAGWLADRLHDAAIIQDGERAYALVIFTKMPGTYDEARGKQVIDAITAASAAGLIARQ